MSSLQEGKKEAVEWIKAHFHQGDTCLDVGACDGTWYHLVGDYLEMDAVEIFRPYIKKHKLDEKYRKVFQENICLFKYDYYDLIIFGDVLEHMSVKAAQEVIAYAKPRCKNMLIAVPFESEQGAIRNNPWEVHIQPDLTPEKFEERYPGFKPIYQSDNYAYYAYEYQPTIAVIVPYYNSEKWLDRCCESLIRQKDSDMKFVLVDDSSTDDSAKIVKRYAENDSRFQLVSTSEREGVSGARNEGLHQAFRKDPPDWVTFLDADDELCEDAYMHFRAYMRQSDNRIIQFEHYRHYVDPERTIVNKRYINFNGLYSLSSGLPKLFCMVWNKMYHASLFKPLGAGVLFRPKMQYGEDEIFNLECLAQDPVIWVDRDRCTTIHHFDNKGSLSHMKAETELFEQAEALTALLRKYKDNAVLCKCICELLSEHWQSPTYIECFAPSEKLYGEI